MRARSLQEYLSTTESTAKFAVHVKRLLRFQQLFETALPPALRMHARVANLRQGKLIILAANSAVAAKLRQFGPRIADVFSKDGTQISEIDVRAQVRTGAQVIEKREPVPLPGEAQKQALTRLAADLPDDSPLKSALQGLLRRITER